MADDEQRRKAKGKAKVEDDQDYLISSSKNDPTAMAAASDHQDYQRVDDDDLKQAHEDDQKLHDMKNASALLMLNQLWPPPFRPANGPGSRRPPLTDLCLSKTLSPPEVNHINGKLLLDPFQASQLLSDPGIEYEPPSPSFESMLIAFDEDDRRYDLLLSVRIVGYTPIYSIGRDWSLFVRVHDLIGEDEILFFKVYDPNVARDYFYVLRYFKKPRHSIR